MGRIVYADVGEGTKLEGVGLLVLQYTQLQNWVSIMGRVHGALSLHPIPQRVPQNSTPLQVHHPRNWRITNSPQLMEIEAQRGCVKLPKVTQPVKGITARVLEPLDSPICEKEEFGTQVWKLAWLQSLKRVILQTQGPLGQIANQGSA